MPITNDPGDFKFCPYCTKPLVLREDGMLTRLACTECDWIYYRNPVAAAGGVVIRDDRICLVRRAIAPRRGDWTLPAGFVEYDETPRECAVRELEEETGLQVEVTGIHGVYEGFDDPRHHVVLILYNMKELSHRDVIAGDDADDAGFYTLDNLPGKIAFRAHRLALNDLAQRMGRPL
jgi:8-oxo-dGTP diphosphatase